MLDPFETEFIRSPTILVYPNNLIERARVVTISILQIILACYNDKWRHRPTIRIDTLDHSDLFPIARLYSFNFSTPVVRRYNKDRYNLAYEKACLIEVLNVGFYNIIFDNHILEKSKPNPNNLWIFVLGPLIIIQTVLIYIEL